MRPAPFAGHPRSISSDWWLRPLPSRGIEARPTPSRWPFSEPAQLSRVHLSFWLTLALSFFPLFFFFPFFPSPLLSLPALTSPTPLTLKKSSKNSRLEGSFWNFPLKGSFTLQEHSFRRESQKALDSEALQQELQSPCFFPTSTDSKKSWSEGAPASRIHLDCS